MAEVRGVAVEIETADAPAVAVDVLVLKHAQGSYGVDAVATVFLCPRADELKFDVQSERCILYSSIQDLEDQLAGELRQLVG